MTSWTPLSLSLLAACAASPRPVAGPAIESRPDAAPLPSRPEPIPNLQLPEGVRPVHAALELRLDPEADGFSGEVTYDLELSEQRSFLWLNGQGLIVSEASVEAAEGRIPARYEEVDPVGVARVTLVRPVGPGKVRLRLAWKAPWNVGLRGLYRTELEGRRYLVTQFEPVAARRAFPSFDEPRFKLPWDVTVEVPAGLVAVGNTSPVSETLGDGGRRRLILATTRPLPSYLLAVAVGPWDVVEAAAPPNEIRATPLPVRGLAPAGRGKDLAFALRDGNQLLSTLERWFATPFPYPKLDHLAIPNFGPGAMENAGLITYREGYLLRREGEASLASKSLTWGLMAHETAHQWFGNLVTMPWWTDTWLNESFANWIEDEAVATWRPQSQARRGRIGATNGVMATDSLAAARAVRQPLVRIEAVGDQFDNLSYAKGAAVISMFEQWLGPDRFRDGVRAYLAAHVDGSGDAEHLFDALSATGGRKVGAAFHTFLDQPGVPLVTARSVCEGGSARLELSQRRWLPLGSRAESDGRWRIPVCARWGTGAESGEACALLEEPTGTLPLGPGCPAWVMPNARGAGYYRTAQPSAGMKALLATGWQRLTVEERLVAAQDAIAAFQAGALTVAEVIPLMTRLARDPDGDLAQVPLEPARRLVERVAPPGTRAAARRWAAALYGPTLARLGLSPRPGEPEADTALRVEVASFVAQVGRNPVLRARLASLGLAWLNPGGPALRPEAVPVDLVDLAAAVAVEDGGVTAFDLAVRRLATERDATTRARLHGALASARDPALVTRAQELTASPDTPPGELLRVTRMQARNPDLQQAAWDAYRLEADMEAARIPGRAPFQPMLVAGFCDADRLVEARAFFEPRAQKVPAMARPLANSLESIELCIAAAAEHGEQARRFFQAQPH